MDCQEENQIRIRPLADLCEESFIQSQAPPDKASGTGHVEEDSGEKSGDEESLPFVCHLCKTGFKKKLFLNNHVERRHGIKFVFTEKGRKVKLIRMPEELMIGEKLDPCVEALLQQNGQNASNVLGVQPVLEQKKLQQACPTAHEVNPCDLVQCEREFGAGILVDKIHTFAMKKALERKQTPFVAYRPLLSKKLYLLRIQPMNDTTQLLVPATKDDLKASEDVEKENSFYLSHKPTTPQQQSLDSSSNSIMKNERTVMRKPCIKFSNVAIVATAAQAVVDENSENLEIRITPPPPGGQMSLIKSLHFARTIVQCRPKRLRCLSMPPKATARPISDEIDTSRQKRKYTRRCRLEEDDEDVIRLPKKRGRKPKVREILSSDEEEEHLPKKRGRKPKIREILSSDEEEEHLPKKRGRKPNKIRILSSDDEEEEHLPKKRGRKPKIRETLSSDDEEEEHLPKKRGRKPKVRVLSSDDEEKEKIIPDDEEKEKMIPESQNSN